MNPVIAQKTKAFKHAKSINATCPELMREIRNVINRALETGASFQEAKKELSQLLTRHPSIRGLEVKS